MSPTGLKPGMGIKECNNSNNNKNLFLGSNFLFNCLCIRGRENNVLKVCFLKQSRTKGTKTVKLLHCIIGPFNSPLIN